MQSSICKAICNIVKNGAVWMKLIIIKVYHVYHTTSGQESVQEEVYG